MKKKFNILTGLIVISLALNIYAIARLGTMERNITNRLNNMPNQTIHWLRNEMDSLHQSIGDIKQESVWIQGIQFIPNQDKSSPEEIHLNLEWSFKELERGADVSVVYGDKNKSKEWEKAKVYSLGTNRYSASLILSPEKDYEYQLISGGRTIRTDAIRTIPSHHHKPSPLIKKGAGWSTSNGQLLSMEIFFAQQEPVLFDFFKINGVRAEIYQKDDCQRIDLKPRSEGWELDLHSLDLEEPLTKVIIEVEYGDGKVERKDFSQEILEMISEVGR